MRSPPRPTPPTPPCPNHSDHQNDDGRADNGEDQDIGGRRVAFLKSPDQTRDSSHELYTPTGRALLKDESGTRKVPRSLTATIRQKPLGN
jgi:hypothetical protein